MDNKPYSLYLLLDPREGHTKIRYVGKTKNLLRDRLARHIRDSRKLNHHRANWIRSVIRDGFKPIIKEVCRYSSLEEVNSAEKLFIKYMFNLTNLTEGGDGGIVSRKPNISNDLVCDLYLKGMNSTKISKTYKTCKKRVLAVLRQNNILRPHPTRGSNG